MARLRVLKDGVELQTVDLAQIAKSQVMLGRAPESDIKLDDRAVGREHAVFLINSKGIVVQKRSKFGKMSINGAELAESALKPGDVVSIADYLVRIEGGDTAAVQLANASTDAAPAALTAAVTAADDHLEMHALPTDGPTGQLKLAEAPTGATPEQPAAPEFEAPALDTAPSGDGSEQGGDMVFDPAANEAGAASGDGMFVESERTAMIPQAQVVTKLVFKPGEANVEEFPIKKSEISIGRGSNCDIILNDKKSSRKHLVLKKVGMNFVAQDQGSANGTYLNGVKINEQELAGDDVLRIGTTEFVFKAESAEYFENQQNYEGVQEQVDPNAEMVLDQSNLPMDPNAQGGLVDQGLPLDPNAPGAAPSSMDTVGAIPGLAAGGPPKKQTLLEKFRALPPLRKAIVAGAIAGVLFMLMQEEEQVKPKAKSAVSDVKGDPQFEALPPEKKQFVMNTYQLAFDFYKNKEYERAIYEVDKILTALPSGYKDAKDIKAYAQKSIDIIKAQEDEKRRKEAEAKLRAEIDELVKKAEELVLAGKYDDAKLVFGQVLEKDPENPTVARLKQQLEDREAKLKAEEETRKEKEFKRKMLEGTIREARDLYKAGKYYNAIDKLADAPIIFSEDTGLLEQAKEIIRDSHHALKERAAPHVAAGKAALSEESFQVAREAFEKALKIDYKNREALTGIEKIRQILHDRAKKLYTEAVIREGISDYMKARRLYIRCLKQAMPGDVYYGRCSRKVKRLELIDRKTAAVDDTIEEDVPSDPQKPSLPTPFELEQGGQ